MPSRHILHVAGLVAYRVAFVTIVGAVLMALPAMFDQPETTLAPATPTPLPPEPLDEVDIELAVVARLPQPTALAVRRDDDALYVTSKKGLVYAVRGERAEVILDISGEISNAFEQGLLGIAFTPDGNRVVINFTNRKDASVTRTYLFADGEPKLASARDVLVVKKPAKIHNAGNLAFGPDDYLYLSLGDGGLSGDPKNNAQSPRNLLGKIHRIELLPDGTYTIPPNNPFDGTKNSRREIWALGFRNPWRFSFDRRTGDLWIADVGRDTYEEINRQPAAAAGGRNYGWPHREGPKRNRDDRFERPKPPKDHVRPVHWYKHTDEVCAVTGGFVYRGTKIAGLDGAYLYSDFCRGGIEAIRLDDDEVAEKHRWDLSVGQISSFGQDAEGELYVLALTEGVVYRIEAT